MPRLTLNDLKRSGLKAVAVATGNQDDITTASGTTGAIRIMAAVVAHTVAATLNIEDAATYTGNDLQLKSGANNTGFISFEPYGWRVSYISTNLAAGTATIFYLEDE